MRKFVQLFIIYAFITGTAFAAATLTLYENDGTSEIDNDSMDLVKSSTLSLGSNTSYVGGLIYAEVDNDGDPWKLALVTEGNNRASNLVHSENSSKTLAFKVDCENDDNEGTTITSSDFTNNYACMRKENDSGVNIFHSSRSTDLSTATMMSYDDTYMNTHTQIPFSFGISLHGSDLIAGEYETEVKFLLYYD